ncbi:hypothetical protein FOL47_009021 [Perkinsus chesapeaki]|uniref:Uncharacterized protein n=1 Tax=Perkinsus chesapeaki TaxID=330153 RepID=A0A7J6LAV4_PERCH|nr:hypothetical protein FOL47_009021 [Perkinsus chesapeaki]
MTTTTNSSSKKEKETLVVVHDDNMILPDGIKLKDDIINAYPLFKNDVISYLNDMLTIKQLSLSSELKDNIIDYYAQCLDYTTKDGKLNRGTSLVAAFDILNNNNNNNNNREIALKLAWCVEVLQSHFLTLDDVMDSSLTRRGQHLDVNAGIHNKKEYNKEKDNTKDNSSKNEEEEGEIQR